VASRVELQAAVPSHEILSLSTEMNIVREEEVVPPINDLSVDIVSVLGTEGWVPW
jgi:hypothetical protein